MKLERANARAKTTNKVALEAEKEKDTAEKAVEELKRQLQPKRTRSDADAGDAHEILTEVDNWDLRDHRREGTHVQNCRNVQVGSLINQQQSHPGKDGFFLHTRLGLVGWIAYWCCGDAALAVFILVALIKTLGLTELLSDSLVSRNQKESETNVKIVDLFKDALDEIKHCRNEQQRVEFHIALACVMPTRETQGTNNGWIARICDRLSLKRGKRSQKNGGRPYESDQEWDPSAGSDDTSDPVAMIVNSNDLGAVDFPLTEVRSLQLDAVARGGHRTRGAAVRKLQGVGNSTFVLSVENDNICTLRGKRQYLHILGIVKSYFSSFLRK